MTLHRARLVPESRSPTTQGRLGGGSLLRTDPLAAAGRWWSQKSARERTGDRFALRPVLFLSDRSRERSRRDRVEKPVHVEATGPGDRSVCCLRRPFVELGSQQPRRSGPCENPECPVPREPDYSPAPSYPVKVYLWTRGGRRDAGHSRAAGPPGHTPRSQLFRW
jgi:hypothetical protein